MAHAMIPHNPPYTGPIRDPRGEKVVIAASILPAVTTFVVGARVYARWTQSTGVGLDDLFIVLSLVRPPHRHLPFNRRT